MRLVKTVFLLFTLILVVSCESKKQSPTSDIVYGKATNGLLCGIRVATRSPYRLNVFVKNVGTKVQKFTISRRHYSTWADVYIDGQHYYPNESTLLAGHAVAPEKIEVAPGETRTLPWCYTPVPEGSHTITLKYWLNDSPLTKDPGTLPFFESGTITVSGNR